MTKERRKPKPAARKRNGGAPPHSSFVLRASFDLWHSSFPSPPAPPPPVQGRGEKDSPSPPSAGERGFPNWLSALPAQNEDERPTRAGSLILGVLGAGHRARVQRHGQVILSGDEHPFAVHLRGVVLLGRRHL